MSSVSAEVFWLLTLFFLIVIIAILCYKCKNKQGEYRVVADRAIDGSDGSLPLTTKHKELQV